jgi:thymidylate synthase (FAD)
MKLTDEVEVDYIDHMGSDLRVVQSARISFGADSSELTDKDKKLIKYLAQHKHETPFEHCTMTVKIRCPMPISKQIMRHRVFAYNEISRRYTTKDIEFFVPPKWREQSTDNKQCSEGEVEGQELASLIYQNGIDDLLNRYDQLIYLGVSREQARFILPQGLMTEFYMTGNLRNWCSFVKLRYAKDAQGEAQEVAQQVRHLLLTHFPVSAKELLDGKESTE